MSFLFLSHLSLLNIKSKIKNDHQKLNHLININLLTCKIKKNNPGLGKKDSDILKKRMAKNAEKSVHLVFLKVS